ncbi:MAG: DNA mismatch repair endonuclease MutL [Nitrospira sp.]|nr:DNA mismatch repair endonuclease MutL [Nitrospira sp. NTP2]MCK6492299.1 DNA mismatch repair endonuclease MutL [Nitrospira sp.]MEB2338022.1 DNA mismatch repair endonuclease MutL [Nitrospirales bacterium]QOJ36340.1 MAG: DNA mismatch repair endonuclease MutL [Nitrospira sp.]RIK59919.1 MAG: DNA mismatch repair endonuclease MutL [Nitrospira sp.]
MDRVGNLRKIHLLPSDVIGRIAAGEVVERPAAVVKELIENSLDAGSSTITVEVKDGGLSLIRVIDDGEGMSRPDACVAFERHATSKLQSDHQLAAIRTMGFRGEALPSIAAVSKVRLTTMPRPEPLGTQLWLEGGTLDRVEDVAAAPGTTVEVAELFYNTPARKKFLKSTTTEFSHLSHTVQQAALAWPQVHVRLIHNGYDVFDFPAVSSHRDRVLQVHRAAFGDRALPVEAERGGLSVKGFIIDPVRARAGRTPQELFVNRRPIKNATVQHAVIDGYSSFLAKGHVPLFVLFLEVEPQRVDVNVHPTKREVRFADSESVHQLVRSAVRHALGRIQVVASTAAAAHLHPHVRTAPFPPIGVEVGGGTDGERTAGASAGPAPEQTSFVGEGAVAYDLAEAVEVVALGQMSRTFLIAQVGTELQVVDQHTAHERVLFERLWRAWQGRSIASQPLLLPEPLELPVQQALILQRHLPELERLGLLIEPFGPASFLIRSLPILLGHTDLAALVQDLVEDLEQWDSISSLEYKVKPVLASLACHGAVRAGRAMALPEIKQLVQDWVAEGLIMTCPHGRRTAFRLSAEELARLFDRA